LDDFAICGYEIELTGIIHAERDHTECLNFAIAGQYLNDVTRIDRGRCNKA